MSTPDLDGELMALLDRMAARDERALQRLYTQTSPRLYGLALRVVRRPEWAQEVLQEAYLGIWRTAPEYRATLSPPLAWMGLIVRSRALDLLRRHRMERSPLLVELDAELADTLDGGAQGPADLADASEQAVALHQCLDRLEQRQRQVVSLAYLQDLSHSELAQRLQLPLGTVKTWIRRGLEQLRQCMARYV